MRGRIAPALLVLGPLLAVAAPPPNPTSLDAGAAARFAALALKCLHQEYPNHLSHTLGSDADARPPRELTPAFYGCYDWHSAVHGHWLLVRLLRLFPGAPFASQARAAVSRSLTVPNISAEVAYLRGEGRASFERPYGLAWLLQLAAELRGWDDPDAQRWSAGLQPLESEAAARLKSWLPKLHYPIRIGEHDQTAFSFGLVWDWAGVAGDDEMRALLRRAAQRLPARPQLPARLRALGRGFPLAVPGGGGLHASRARTARVRPLVVGISCAPAGRRRSGRPGAVAVAGRGHRSRRSEARASRWTQPEPRLDASGHRPRPAAAGWAYCGAARRRSAPPRRGAARRNRRALRGRPLAGHVCGVSDQRRGSAPLSAAHRALRGACSAERLAQLRDQVLHILHAHRQADEAVADPEGLARRCGERGVRHDPGVLDEALHAAQTLRQREQTAALE